MNSNNADIWTTVLRKLQTGIVSDIDFDHYLKDTEVLGIDGRVLKISVRDGHAASWLHDELANDISRILRQLDSTLNLVKFEVVAPKDDGEDGDKVTVVWDFILSQLQMEMPRASFDTWVRDTQALSLDGDTLTVGVRNMYARDWLDSRLKTAIKRLLVENLNRDIELIFVVEGASDKTIANDDTETVKQQVGDTTWFELKAQYSSLYDAIVIPSKVVPLNAYFLRFLPTTGPEVGCLAFAFKQVAYLMTSRTNGTISERFYIDDLVEWCGGMSRRTVQKYLVDPETWKKLEGLVRRDSIEKEWSVDSGGTRRLPVQFTVELSLPLTPADAESLTKWLTTQMDNGVSPVNILDEMIKVAEQRDGNIRTGVEELVPLQNNYNSKSKYSPMNVNEVLNQVFVNAVEKKQLDKKILASYAAKLEKLIMPSKDLLMVSHFFAKNCWNHLKPGPGWLVAICKDKTFKSERDTMVVKGGFREMARWLGLSDDTVRKWFTEKYTENRLAPKKIDKVNGGVNSRKGGREKKTEVGDLRYAVMHVFLSVVDEKRQYGGSSLTIQVFQEDLPFEIFEAALRGGVQGVEQLAQSILDYEYDPTNEVNTPENTKLILSKEDGSVSTINPAQFAPSDRLGLHYQSGSVCTIGLARFALSKGSVCTITLARFALETGSVCTSLISSTSETNSNDNSGKTLTNSIQPQSAAGAVGGGLAVPNVWNLDTLLKIGRIKKDERKKYNNSNTWAYLARLLYALSPQGRGIASPAHWALSRLKDREYDLPEFNALAKLSPYLLVMLAYKTARGQSIAMDPALVDYSQIWRNAMGDDGFVGEKVLVMLLGHSPINSEIETVKEFVGEDGNLNREIEKHHGRK